MEPEKTPSISEMIGLFLALAFMLYNLYATVRDAYGKKKPGVPTPSEPQEYEPEDLLEEEEEEEEEPVMQKVPLPPPVSLVKRQEPAWRPPEEKFVFRTNIEDRNQRSAIDFQHLDIGLKSPDDVVSEQIKHVKGAPTTRYVEKEAPIAVMLKKLPSKKMLIITSEILRPPVGFRRQHLL
jgi:hypothetical protein